MIFTALFDGYVDYLREIDRWVDAQIAQRNELELERYEKLERQEDDERWLIQRARPLP